jgi:hypothetical protein
MEDVCHSLDVLSAGANFFEALAFWFTTNLSA